MPATSSAKGRAGQDCIGGGLITKPDVLLSQLDGSSSQFLPDGLQVRVLPRALSDRPREVT